MFNKKKGASATPAPQRMGGQSGFNAPRPPSGMATRPPLIANKARGTMASHSYSQIPASMSGMGQMQRPMREVMQNKRQADASGYSTMPLQKAQPTGTAGFAAGIKPKRTA
jgi:hypothetical protein